MLFRIENRFGYLEIWYDLTDKIFQVIGWYACFEEFEFDQDVYEEFESIELASDYLHYVKKNGVSNG